MGPFRRGKREVPAPTPSIELKVQETAYRRLGDAMATVVVTLVDPPPDDARLVVRSQSSAISVDPMMVTHEAPGTKAETRRLWFAVELSAVMFGDGEFALQTDEGETPLPHPVAQPAWGDDDPEQPGVPGSALTEAGLRAAVAALEDRCRTAERANAELTADGRRMGEAVAATLAEVQREREQLLELVARTQYDDAPRAEAGETTAPGTDPAGPAADAPRPDSFLERLNAARGAASDAEPG